MLLPPPSSWAYCALSANLTGSPMGFAGTVLSTGNGSWGTATQLLPSLGFEAELLILNIYGGNASTSNTSRLVRIILDRGDGYDTDNPLIPNLIAGHGSGSFSQGRAFAFPIRIPAGATVGMQAIGSTALQCFVAAAAYGGYRGPGVWRAGRRVVAYGINEAAYTGTVVTAGNNNLYGSFTPVGTPTVADHFALAMAVNGPASGAWNAMTTLWQGGIGSQPIPGLMVAFAQANTETVTLHWSPMNPVFVPIPAGTQLMARGKKSDTTAGTHTVAFYGVS